MPDVEKARAAIESILKLPTINKETRYYASLALSHLLPPYKICPRCLELDAEVRKLHTRLAQASEAMTDRMYRDRYAR